MYTSITNRKCVEISTVDFLINGLHYLLHSSLWLNPGNNYERLHAVAVLCLN
jgi:hypothetical protein